MHSPWPSGMIFDTTASLCYNCRTRKDYFSHDERRLSMKSLAYRQEAHHDPDQTTLLHQPQPLRPHPMLAGPRVRRASATHAHLPPIRPPPGSE